MTTALLFGQLVLSSVFAVSAVPKARGFAAFQAHVEATVPLPHGVARLVAGLALAAEVLTATALLHPGTARAGSALGLILLIGFTAYLARLIGQGEGAPCGCGGSSDEQAASGVHLLRNGLLLALAAGVFTASITTAHAEHGVLAYAASAAPAAALGALLFHMPDVLNFFRTSLGPGS
ncbi:MauE/DoxX family redox-associated membrane protein [Streptomyces sp. NPDC004126]|uniref:MauE/DoxX family redox-associated membrane protein n=1 Tax=Streptomyces sp. NPDC004126 TaxID=3390695 RepID=UPI003D08D088